MKNCYFYVALRSFKVPWYLLELEFIKNWPWDELFKFGNSKF